MPINKLRGFESQEGEFHPIKGVLMSPCSKQTVESLRVAMSTQ